MSKVNNIEYNLWLENDHNTRGHTQWYYFKVVYKDIPLAPEKKTHKVKFNVLNLAKTSSLYQEGMKVAIWSKRRFEQDGTGWFRGGEEISYTQNDIPRYTESGNAHQKKGESAFLLNNNGAGEGVETYFTFSFKYEFEPNTNDEVWFAHAIPYTYSQMQNSVKALVDDKRNRNCLKVNLLCQSLARNPVPLLTITENVGTFLDYYEDLRLQHHLPNHILKKGYRRGYMNARKLMKQCGQANPKVQPLLEAAMREDLKQFVEANEDQLLAVSPHFKGF